MYNSSKVSNIFTTVLLVTKIATVNSLSNHITPKDFGRRKLIKDVGTAALLPAFISSTFANPENAMAEETNSDLIVPSTKSVVILGANGGTGKACVSTLLQTSRPCIASSRSGNFLGEINPSSNTQFQTAAIDVTSYDSIASVISNKSNNVGAVLFAASASTKGGDAYSVDKDGVINAAKACIDCNIPRLVVVSSGAVSRPDSSVYQFLNLVGKGIMEAKIQGENEVRRLYANPDVIQKGLGYTIIRPGGLTNTEPLGVSELTLNQGDTISGRLSRFDVASLCVNTLDYPQTFDTTFECYETLTAKPLESVGLSNILRQKNAAISNSGRCQGDSWNALFAGLSRDDGH